MTEQQLRDISHDVDESPIITHKNIRRYEASAGYIVMMIFGMMTLMMLCGMTLTFANLAINTGLASAETVLGVRGDGVPPSLSVPPPPPIGITPLPTDTFELVPTVTPFGNVPITGTGVITP